MFVLQSCTCWHMWCLLTVMNAVSYFENYCLCWHSKTHCVVENCKYYTYIFFLIFLLILLIPLKFLKFIRKQFLKRKYLFLCLKKWWLHLQKVYQWFLPVAKMLFYCIQSLTYMPWLVFVLLMQHICPVSSFFNINVLSICLQWHLWPVLSCWYLCVIVWYLYVIHLLSYTCWWNQTNFLKLCNLF